MKNYKNYKIVFGLLVQVLIIVDINAQSQKELPMTFYWQQGNNTCWAASMRMVVNAGGAIRIDDEMTLRRNAFGPSAPDEDVWLHGVSPSVQSLLTGYSIQVESYGTALPLPQIVNAIDISDFPTMVGWRSTTSSLGHVVVIKGYREVRRFMSNPVSGRLVVNDPSQGENIEMTHDEIIGGNDYGYSMQQALIVRHPSRFLAPPDPSPWDEQIPEAGSGATIVVPPKIHNIKKSLIVPETSTNVTLQFQPGATLNFTE
ncbi:MAG: hypothetical protein LBB56_00775, partial [Chitinispirillales bacterium]|nr:hypothetical protein [Chitinispirillales bacterium]